MYSTELELIFYKLDGLAFQAFFNDLMSFGIRDFCPVRQRNDGGNDGFVCETGTFYQVCAPESITRSTIENASSKIIEDFDKLAKNWHYLIKLEEYIFVFNDKFKGADSVLIHRIKKIEKDCGIRTHILTAIHLIDIFHSHLTPTQQKILLAKHSIGSARDPAIKVAAKIITNRLSIKKWKTLDEQLSFFSLYKSDLNILSEIRSSLFSMDFPEEENKIIADLVESINMLVNLFYSQYTTERNGEVSWDNSWKRIHNNPNANFYDKEQKKWESEIQHCTMSLCGNLNIFAKYVRQRQITDFLDYGNYTVIRRVGDTVDEYVEIIP